MGKKESFLSESRGLLIKHWGYQLDVNSHFARLPLKNRLSSLPCLWPVLVKPETFRRCEVSVGRRYEPSLGAELWDLQSPCFYFSATRD